MKKLERLFRKLAIFPLAWHTARSVVRVFSRQRVGPAALLGVLVVVLGLLFLFVSVAPMLSPFVYPLF